MCGRGVLAGGLAQVLDGHVEVDELVAAPATWCKAPVATPCKARVATRCKGGVATRCQGRVAMRCKGGVATRSKGGVATRCRGSKSGVVYGRVNAQPVHIHGRTPVRVYVYAPMSVRAQARAGVSVCLCAHFDQSMAVTWCSSGCSSHPKPSSRGTAPSPSPASPSRPDTSAACSPARYRSCSPCATTLAGGICTARASASVRVDLRQSESVCVRPGRPESLRVSRSPSKSIRVSRSVRVSHVVRQRGPAVMRRRGASRTECGAAGEGRPGPGHATDAGPAAGMEAMRMRGGEADGR